MKKIENKKSFFNWFSIIMASLVFLLLVIYYIIRVYFLFTFHYHFIDFVFALLLFFAESFILYQTVGSLVQIISNNTATGSIKFNKLKTWPEITILVPVKDEPAIMLEQTLVTIAALDYAKMKIVLLDGSSKENAVINKKICAKYKIAWWTPAQPPKSKAEIINKYLPFIKTPYLAVFDADQSPLADFLHKIMPIIESNKHIGFVQAPQFYSNTQVSRIAKAASMQQAIFFEGICEAKSSLNAMFCCGTNVVLRTEALKAVGGFDEKSITEDFATSVEMHAKGYTSYYFNHVKVFGLAPESLNAYFKQQFRWAAGTMSTLPKLVKLFFANPAALSFSQWWEYGLSATYYFTGAAFTFLMICPLLFLLFGIPVYFMNPIYYIGSFVPFFIMNLANYYINMRRRHYGWSQLTNGLIMSSISSPILVLAFISVLSGKKLSFTVTPKMQADVWPWYQFWPWLLAIFANLLAVAVGLWHRNSYEGYALVVNIFWCLYHSLLLMLIFLYNEKGKVNSEAVYAPLAKYLK